MYPPIRSDPALFMANLFQYYFEDEIIWKTKRKDLVIAQQIVFSCFIDDLTAINDGGEFEKALDEIYPPELELRRTYTSPFEALFLDLNIKISNKKHT